MKPAAKADPVAIESSIAGKFRGWEPKQVFTLANGQRWQVANNDRYYAPAAENVRVIIVPAAFGGFWMRFPALGAEVRVNLVGEN